MARLGRSYPTRTFIARRPAQETLSVTVVLGTDDADQGLVSRPGIARTPTVFTSEAEPSTVLSGVTAGSAVGSISLSVTGMEILLTGVQSASTVHADFAFTGLVTSGKWQEDKTKKNVPRGRWGRLKNFDNKNFEVGEDFVPVFDQYGQWRWSTITRDSIILSSLQSISDNLGNQGKP